MKKLSVLLLKYNLEKEGYEVILETRGNQSAGRKLKNTAVGYSAGLDAARNFRRGNLQDDPQQAGY